MSALPPAESPTRPAVGQIRKAQRPPVEITVDLLSRKHLKSVQRIDTMVYKKPWSMALLQQEMTLEDRTHIVALDRGRVVGHAGLLTAVDEGHITTVAVDPAAQGRGIATGLLLALINRAHGLDVTALTLEVRVSNTKAQDLYRRFGFVPAGMRKSYYADTKEDAVVMWAVDVDQPEYRAKIATLAAGIPTPKLTTAAQALLGGPRG